MILVTDGSRRVPLPEVTILSVNSFCRHEDDDAEDGADGDELLCSQPSSSSRSRIRCKHRQYSIPNLLNNATATREITRNQQLRQFSLDHEPGHVPRSRLVSLVADRLQQRPVYAPCHPIDLEGLQETAV